MVRGFTLIELSIVLIIIGLLVGGVLAGRELIDSSKKRALLNQIKQYKTAHYTFQLKYDCIAGDCDNATLFFSGTADGDGDNQVEYPGGGADGEYLRAWQQFGLADLIDNDYTGVVAGSQPTVRIGTNTPASVLTPDGGYTLLYSAAHGHRLLLGAERDSSYTANAAISGSDAHEVDLKADDGLATSGKFRGLRGLDQDSGCVDGDSEYLLTETTANCMMWLAIEK